MKHPERVEDYLEHIAETIARTTEYLRHTDDFADFEWDQSSQDAVVRNIEIIGEAVTKINGVAPDFIAQHPDIPWARIRAMRNVMIHQYFFVDLRIVWGTVKSDLPQLRATSNNYRFSRGSPSIVLRRDLSVIKKARL